MNLLNFLEKMVFEEVGLMVLMEALRIKRGLMKSGKK